MGKVVYFTDIIPKLVKHSPNTVLLIVSNPGKKRELGIYKVLTVIRKPKTVLNKTRKLQTFFEKLEDIVNTKIGKGLLSQFPPRRLRFL